MDALKPVDPGERTWGGIDFFILWAGAGVSLAEIWAGGMLRPMGFVIGIAAILVGHILGNTALSLGGLLGSDHGIPTMVALRPSFGIRGSFLASILNIIQLIGWTAVMIWIGGNAADALLKPVLGSHPRAWMVGIGLVTLAWSFVGETFWKWLQRISVTGLLILSLAMTLMVFKSYGWHHLLNAKGTSGMPIPLGIDLVIAMPISWLPLVADYSRFSRKTTPAFWGTWGGYFLMSSWMYLVGLAAAIATKSDTPDAMVMQLMASSGWVFPALLIVLFSTFTTTFLDIYSTAVSAQNLFPALKEKRGIVITGILGILIALIFDATQYENFLLLIGSFFCPMFGVALTDYFYHRKRQIRVEALDERGGAYWYTGGINWKAVIAWLVGVVLYQASFRLGWSIGATLPSMIVSAVIYLLLRPTRSES
ncbi:MAG: putative hydroxymethylpyrimidine transporter CytX [Deltaproteobacteria bacterium]|nr:MAG: putative hydroxymethylpyrimidine transporter CytX [Deltaproteobacteria bacterium]